MQSCCVRLASTLCRPPLLRRSLRGRPADGHTPTALSVVGAAAVAASGGPGAMRFIDIGANLLDSMYMGSYNDKTYHAPDIDAVLERAWSAGVAKIIVTAGSLSEARRALEFVQRDARLFCTVGVHPTRCGEFDAHPGGPDAYLAELGDVLLEGTAAKKVVAVGECGLDYDRLHFCDKDTQKKYFALQFKLAKESGLPMCAKGLV